MPAPNYLTPITVDQAITVPETGYPTPQFGQMIERILKAIGQPPSSGSSGSSGNAFTIFESISNLTTAVENIQIIMGAVSTTIGIAGRVASLEAAAYHRVPLPTAPRLHAATGGTATPDLTASQALSWWRG